MGDAALAVAVAAFQIRGTLLVTPGQADIRPLIEPALAGYLLLAAGGLVLLGRRRLPTSTFLAAAAISVAYYLAHYPDGPSWVGLFIALYTLTAHGDGRRSLATTRLDGMEVRAGASPHVIVGCRTGVGPGR